MTSRLSPTSPFPLRALERQLVLAAVLGLGASPAFAQTPTPATPDTQPTELAPVVVRGSNPTAPRSGGQVSRGTRVGLLGDTETQDTPFSTVGFTAQAIANQQATTVTEVLANDPSVRVSAPTGGLLDALYIRGFPINEGNVGEFAFDGVFGVAPTYRVFSDYVERIELTKGPTALLNGMAPNGGIGGSVNIVPKRAGAVDLTRIGVDFETASQLGARVDLSRRFGEQREFGVRFNGSVRDGDTAVDKQSRSARVGALALDYQGRRVRATFDYLNQQEDVNAPTRPVFLGAAAAVPSTPAAPDGRRNVTQAWEWSDVNDQSALLRVEADATDNVTVFAGVGAARTEVDRLFGNPTVSNTTGDVTWTPARFRFDIERATADVGARAKAHTGGIEHTVTLQASQYRDRLARGSRNGTAVTSNLHAPAESAAQDVALPDPVAKVSETRMSGIALTDTLAMDNRRVLVTLGVRAQSVRADNFATTGAVSQHYDESATTPMAGVVFKPWENVSFYGNYIEGLSKGDVAPATASNAGAAMAPYRAKQYEVGAKFDHGSLTSTVSLFQITKPSGQLTGTVYAADAEQRNRGIEFNVQGQPVPRARVLAGLTLLDATLVSTSNPATVGKDPIGVPRTQANLGGEWDTAWVPGLTLTGGVAYAGKQYVDTANLRSIPSWTRVDAGARWRTDLAGRATVIRANIRNLFDRDHWAGVSSFGGLSQGSPRTLQLSATTDF